LKLEVLSLYVCADQATRFICSRGRNNDLLLLDIPDRVCKAMEFKVHRGAAMVLAIAYLHFGVNLYDAIGLPNGSIMMDLDLLPGDFDVAVNPVLVVVLVEEIIHDLLKGK
jgi:hypothetical protein